LIAGLMMADTPLSNISFFQGLPDDLLCTIQKRLKSRLVPAGEVLFNMGDPGDEMIIVQGGKIAIYAPERDNLKAGKTIRLFEPGQFLGEMALIDHKPRSLSARAEVPSTILTLGGEDFRNLISNYPEIASNAMSGLSERVRYTTDFLTQVRKWVQRITEGNYSAGQFNQEMEAWIKSTTVSATQVDKSMVTLAAEFAEMVMKVQKREQDLQEQIALLRIEIDQAKRKEEVQQIIGSDYYQSLRDRVKRMRAEADDED